MIQCRVLSGVSRLLSLYTRKFWHAGQRADSSPAPGWQMQRQRLIPSPAEFLRRARGAHELFWLALQHALRLPDAPFRRPRVRALQGLAACSRNSVHSREFCHNHNQTSCKTPAPAETQPHLSQLSILCCLSLSFCVQPRSYGLFTSPTFSSRYFQQNPPLSPSILYAVRSLMRSLPLHK